MGRFTAATAALAVLAAPGAAGFASPGVTAAATRQSTGFCLGAAAAQHSCPVAPADRIPTLQLPLPPLRISPNFAPAHAASPRNLQDRRRSSYAAAASVDRLATHMDGVKPMGSMAWAEFRDWVDRTLARNLEGQRFEFDTRQWKAGISKWWMRAVEADEAAKVEFQKQYGRLVAAAGSDLGEGGAEEDWSNIYFECSSCLSGGGGGFDDLAQQQLVPIPIRAMHTEEIMDCAVYGSWEVSYGEDGYQEVRYKPR